MPPSIDFFGNPSNILEVSSDFLELPRWKPTDLGFRSKKSYEPMSSTTRERLNNFFEPHNQRLYEYLGVDFGW